MSQIKFDVFTDSTLNFFVFYNSIAMRPVIPILRDSIRKCFVRKLSVSVARVGCCEAEVLLVDSNFSAIQID